MTDNVLLNVSIVLLCQSLYGLVAAL